MDALKIQALRVKVESVKIGIDREATLFNELGRARNKSSAELCVKLAAANRQGEVAKNKLTDRMDTLESKVLGTLNLEQDKLAAQDVVLAKLASVPTH